MGRFLTKPSFSFAMFFRTASTLLLCASALLLPGVSAHPEVRKTSGCGISYDFYGQSREVTFQSGGRDRTYRFHLPSNYDPQKAYPVVMAFHGRTGSPQGFEGTTQFSNEKTYPNIIAAYPAGVNKSWEGPSYAVPGVSDLQFTTDLVNRMKSKFCIDEARIYAAGHSNGGGFVNTLACSSTHGKHFAAFAGAASALYTDLNGDVNCKPYKSPLPILESHGTADTTVPYNGGPGAGGQLPAIPEWLSRWAKRNKCVNPVTTKLADGITEQSWTCDGIKGLQRHIKYEGLNHDYPGGSSKVPISPRMMAFFNDHKK
ncbi:unnamed protein product [Clonostachys rosea]|uniref:feruloyl esterase n=1 Tax=Bionectria ochroleuca TaxID=29856 RepID=A0ABY6UF94_BIOOC|nr:unnamed protein product [Clonostachys rosea]